MKKIVTLMSALVVLALAVGCSTTASEVAAVEQEQDKLPPEPMAEFEAREAKEKIIADKRAAIKREQELAALFDAHPQWTQEVRDAVRNRHIVVGMPVDAFELVWGKPRRRIVEGGVGGDSEMLVFEKTGGDDYFYFRRGKLMSWTLTR